MDDRLWYVVRNDEVGGWAIALSYAPTSQQRPDQRVVDLIAGEDVAHYIVRLHNEALCLRDQ